MWVALILSLVEQKRYIYILPRLEHKWKKVMEWDYLGANLLNYVSACIIFNAVLKQIQTNLGPCKLGTFIEILQFIQLLDKQIISQVKTLSRSFGNFRFQFQLLYTSLSCYLFILFQCSALSKFVNKVADCGITALHMAALNGYFDCVQLLLDLHANVAAVTFHYGTSMDLIGVVSSQLLVPNPMECCLIILLWTESEILLLQEPVVLHCTTLLVGVT